jgi:hypothetical protein
VLLADPAAVVSDADHVVAAAFGHHPNLIGAGVDRILEQFYDDIWARRNHFARHNASDDLGVESLDSPF